MGYYTTGTDYLSGIQGLLPEEDPAQIAQPVNPVTPVTPGNPVSPLPGPGFTLPFEPPIPITGNPGGGRGDYQGIFEGTQGQNDPLSTFGDQRYSYETYKGNTYKVDNVTGEAVEANMPFGTAGILGSVVGSIPGFENYRFSNDLDLKTQEGLIAANRRKNPFAANNGFYGIGETEEGLQVREDSFYEGLKNLGRDDLTGKGTEETTDQASIDAYARQKEIAKATKDATEQRIAREKITVEKNKRDMQKSIADAEQKQAEKERQAREARNARPAKVNARKAMQLRDRNMGKGTDRSGTGNYGGGYQGGR